jgi:hypothetical protein
MPLRQALAIVLILCTGCAETTVLKAPQEGSAQSFESDRRHCEAQMYTQRMARGRGAPSWTIYDYCMKARGYTREERHG